MHCFIMRIQSGSGMVKGCIFFCIDALFRKNYNKIIRTKNLYFHTGYENIC